MNILVLPDIHGRTFWKEPCNDIDKYDKVVFLGDYLDPYGFEKITVEECISNLKEIVAFAKEHTDKVELLLGNHDMPYYSKTYKSFSSYHCRHSMFHHKTIAKIFEENKDMFKIATVHDNVLFTHAGVTPGWLFTVFTEQYELTSLDDLCFSLNNLLNTREGLKYLFMVSRDRGGYDRYASCIWADAGETMWYQLILNESERVIDKRVDKIIRIKQVFGHTLQAYYDKDRNIVYGDALEMNNSKMLDNGKAYKLDTESFTIEVV